MGYPNGQPAFAWDGPDVSTPAGPIAVNGAITVTVKNSRGVVVGTATYTYVKTTRNLSYNDWCALCYVTPGMQASVLALLAVKSAPQTASDGGPMIGNALPGNVSIGNPTVVTWDNATGGTFSFPITCVTPGNFMLSAFESLFGTSASAWCYSEFDGVSRA
jgi:hypothetical protein